MTTVLAIMVMVAIGWVGFLIFVLPVLAAAKVVQLVVQEKRGTDGKNT